MLARHFYTTLLAGLIASSAFSSPAHARKRARAARTEAARAKERPAAKSSTKATETASTSVEQASESAAPSSAAGEPPAGEAAPRTPAPAPPKARVYSFSGLDVNGNLKAPQLLFFRGRVKQELDTSNPEKRSFLKELERTADAKGL
jgi:hypothetical protein